jgi:histidine ammonia-lyase
VALELLCAARALDLRLTQLDEVSPGARPAPGAGVAAAHAAVREVVRPWEHDHEPGPDIHAVAKLVREGRLAELVRP